MFHQATITVIKMLRTKPKKGRKIVKTFLRTWLLSDTFLNSILFVNDKKIFISEKKKIKMK